MPIRLVIAEDGFLVREALTQLFASDPELELAGVASDTASLLAAIESERPDVVVTDIRMPPFREAEGIRVAAELRETHPDIGVVILSQFAELEFALELFRAGSAGRAYLLKERIGNRAELTAAIRAVADGDSIVDARIVDKLIAERSRSESSAVAGLTERERQVLAEVAMGKSNAAIASSLVLTKRAGGKHINALFLKRGLRRAVA